METSSSSYSSPLSIESFSYSWLANLKPSLLDSHDNSLRTSLDTSDEASFIEMDPKMTPSKRFLIRKSSHDFKFDFPSSPSPLGLVHADELISNGYLMPLGFFANDITNCVDDENSLPSFSDSSNTNSTTTSSTSGSSVSGGKYNSDYSSSMRRSRRIFVSKRLLQKYLNFLRPLYRRIRGGGQGKSGAKSLSGEKRAQMGKSRVYSSETASPRISVAYSAPDECCWRKSCDSDTSIYEAVLHCKRSIGRCFFFK